MTNDDYARKLNQVDRLLNDPTVPIQPDLIWSLLAEVSAHESQAGIVSTPTRPQVLVGPA